MPGNADRAALSTSQKHALILWWTYKDQFTSERIMPSEARYQTLEALERRGLIENLGRQGWGGATSGGWTADVTEEGRKLAEQLVHARNTTTEPIDGR